MRLGRKKFKSLAERKDWQTGGTRVACMAWKARDSFFSFFLFSSFSTFLFFSRSYVINKWPRKRERIGAGFLETKYILQG